MSSDICFFAYGWALDRNLLRKAVGEVGEPKRAVLRGYRLVFDVYSPSWRGGVANIVESAGGIVYGAIYRITSEQLSRLDEAAGVPTMFSRRRVVVEVEGHGSVECFTYISGVGKGRWVKPSKQYVSAVLRGLKQLKYDERIIEEVRKIALGEQVPPPSSNRS